MKSFLKLGSRVERKIRLPDFEYLEMNSKPYGRGLLALIEKQSNLLKKVTHKNTRIK